MAKNTEIEVPARVAMGYGSCERAILNPAVRLNHFSSYQLILSENGNTNNPVTVLTSAFPGGWRNNNGTFNNIGNNGDWWSATENNATNAWKRNMNYDNASVNRNNNNKENGLSVRCVRDLMGMTMLPKVNCLRGHFKKEIILCK